MLRGVSILPHILVRTATFVLLFVLFAAPFTAVFAQQTVDTGLPNSGPNLGSTAPSASPTYVNTGNNPGNPNAPGYFGEYGSNTNDPTAPNSSPNGSADTAAGTDGASHRILNAMVDNQMTEKTYGTLISIGGWVTMVGGYALNIAVGDFVVRMGCLFVANGSDCSGTSLLGLNGQVGGVVNELWQVIRDLFNVLFIFGLIFLGLKTILQSDDTGTRKAIGRLLGAALLVNFSLYFAKLVLDIANFTAVQIYNAMSGGLNATYDSGGYPVIADAFMQTLQITSWFAEDGGLNEIVFAIFAMIFLIYLGFIFLYGAFMIFARFIAMIVLLIFSPVMFLGWIWPSWEKYAGQWRTMFVSYAFFAPAYIFMLYVSLYVLIQLGGGLNGAKYSAIFEEEASSIQPGMLSIFVFYFVGIGLLYASTKVAQSMSNAGGGMIMKTGEKWARGATGYIATVPTGLAGKGLTMASNSWERRTGESNMATRALNYSGTKLKDQKVFGVNTTSKATAAKKWWDESKPAGDKRARGFRDDAEKKAKLATSLASLADNKLNEGDAERTLIGLKPAAVIDMMKEKGGVAALTEHAVHLRPDQVKALEDDKELDKKDVKAVLDARKAGIKKLYTGDTPTKKLSDAQTPELAVFDVSDLADPAMAIQLSDDQIKKLPEPKFIDVDKESIKSKRKEAFIEVIAKNKQIGGIDRQKIVNSWSADDIAKLPNEVFDPNNPDRTPQEKQNIKDFIVALPTNAFVKIQDKKGKKVASTIRTELEAFKNVQGSPREQAIAEWLEKDNIGKNFGKT